MSTKSTSMFGQIVIGPPGSGKSTYCKAMKEFLTSLKRRCAVVNVDPANDILPYSCELDIRELITVDDVMRNLKLGPNGGLVYCVEYLNANVDWLLDRIRKLREAGFEYVLFDFPGQIELYTNHGDVKNIVKRLQDDGLRLASVLLTDAHYCSDPGKFISVLITALTAMVQMEMPHVNVLSKADLLEQYGRLPFNIEYFSEVLDLKYLLDLLDDDPFTRKYRKLSQALCGVVEDYSLVSFQLLQIEDKTSMLNVLREVDKANGYCLREAEELQLLAATMSSSSEKPKLLHTQKLQETYCKK